MKPKVKVWVNIDAKLVYLHDQYFHCEMTRSGVGEPVGRLEYDG